MSRRDPRGPSAALMQGQGCHGLWSLLPGAATAEILARTGADFVVLDLQHGAMSESDLPDVAAAISLGGSVPLVRTRSPHFADIGRPLDLGAHAVFVPNVRNAEHVREVVAASRYAPAGARSVGRLSGGIDEPLVFVVLETATALDDLDALLDVEGLDGVYVGPGDLSLSLQLAGADHRAHLRAVLLTVMARAVDAGVSAGVHAYNGSDAASYAEEGATIVTERRAEYEQGHNVLLAERPQGRFTRQLQIGDGLDAGKVAATYTDGVLLLTIPLSEQAQPRRIEVQHGGGQRQVQVGDGDQATSDLAEAPGGRGGDTGQQDS